MDTKVMEYKCPCCDAGLSFSGGSQQLTCEYCGNSFEIDTVKAFNESNATKNTEEFHWDQETKQEWSDEENAGMRSFICPSCGGEILSDETTAASFCPYCDNPTIMPQQVSGGLKPDAVIPFKKTKEDAQTAFLNLCKGKKLLPKFFTSDQRVEKITGMYVPFWLYDCDGSFDGSFKATRLHHWSDAKFDYTRTDHYLLKRSASAQFEGIPMDGSSKMEDVFMEAIEPFDYSELVDFDTAYLSGYLADKYDVEADAGRARIQERVENSINQKIQQSILGYATCVPTSRNLSINHGKVRYILLPVWMLNTRYKDKIYTFAMNGQTGKMIGTFPICPKQSWSWFFKIFAGVTAIVSIAMMLFVR